MFDLTIRDLPDDVRQALLQRAHQNRRSLEVEARATLTNAVGIQFVHIGETANGRGGTNRVSEADVTTAALAERVKRAQSVFAHLRSPNGSIVDEFIAERREAALAEDADLPATIEHTGAP